MTTWTVKLTDESKGDFKRLDGREKAIVAKRLISLERDPRIGNPLGNKMGMDLRGYFVEDLHRLLFNQGMDDPDGRNKKDRGKFLKLDEYLKTVRQGKQGKTIITVLVTENYLGDYDLLNQFDKVLDKKIQKYGLTNLQKYKPLILCLDDLEIFWALSTEETTVREFEDRLSWGIINV